MVKISEKTKNWLLITFIILFVVVTVLFVIQITNPTAMNPNNSESDPSLAQTSQTPPVAIEENETILPTAVQTPTPIFQPVNLQTGEISTAYNEMGVIILSMMDGLYQHLFVYHPQYFPLTRLTNNQWDDIHPALSADGSQLAYASRQDGYWDIFILDLSNYQHTQVTHSPAYDGAPSWSPDAKWIVFESNQNGNLDIFIQSVEDPNTAPIQLTTNPEADFSPKWSPDGRQILFTSLQTGNEELWVADLNLVDDRFQNVTNRAAVQNGNGSWSPSGDAILFSTVEDGTTRLFTELIENGYGEQAEYFANGNLGIWNPQGTQILSIIHSETTSDLAIFIEENRIPLVPYQQLPGLVTGVTWGNHNLEALLPLLDQNEQPIAAADWESELDNSEDIPAQRFGLVKLDGVAAPYPYLHDRIDESFEQLRQAVAQKTGWDFLATLENAFMPITSPSSPDILENWLYTARAIQLNSVPAANNWMVTVQEEINGKTYWRIYLRTIDQTGAQGLPLRQRIWSFEQRTLGSPAAYEQGGNFSQDIPDGYWVDFTNLAAQYGWRRIPALLNWRTYFPGTQHTVYVHQDALDLKYALLELYPPEALLPPATNSVVPQKMTPTPEPES